MKKHNIIFICIVCVAVTCLAISFGVSALTEKDIATIGEYEITESTLKTYSLLLAVQGESVGAFEKSVQMYARAQIAADEISGTPYDIPKNYKTELLRLEEKNFDRDYEINMAFCNQNGITREELINAVVTSKFNILAEGKHFSMIIDDRIKKDKELGIERGYTSEELTEIYETYMTTRINKLNFVSINNEKIQKIVSSVSLLNFESIGDETIG